MIRIVSVLSLICALAVIANAQTLTAGVARADITPPPGIDLWGYSNRTGPATGTLDPRLTASD